MKKRGKKEASKIKKTIFSIAIALVTVFFIAYAINAISPAPVYKDYCAEFKTTEIIDTKERCEAIGGGWNVFSEEGPRAERIDTKDYCDRDFSCRAEYQSAREGYERNLFVVNIVLGILVLIGAFFLAVEAVSAGLMGGGVLLIVYGTIRYWEELSDILRTIILGIALVILIWFGYKKLK